MVPSTYQQIWKTQQWLQNWKRSVFIPIPKKGSAKKYSNYHTMHSFGMLVRLCSQSHKLSFSSTWTENFQWYMLGLEKAEEPEIKLPTSPGSQRKKRNSRKTSISASLTMLKPLNVGSQKIAENLKRWEYQTTLSVSWETCKYVKKHQLEEDMEQLTGSKFGKEHDKATYCHRVCLIYMQSPLCKMLG